MKKSRRQDLRKLPSVEFLVSSEEFEGLLETYSRKFVTQALREVLEEKREKILAGRKLKSDELSASELAETTKARLQTKFQSPLKRVINVTGTVIHTNLGRALLSEEVCEAIAKSARNYINLEYDLKAGKRGHRDVITEGLLCQLTGAEAATVVNNNAAAVLLSLDTLAKGKEVIVSRGELIEIGGAFRLPEVMQKSGAILREVGTTNRTYLRDYREAINENTALLLKVHPSNYRIVGFAASVELAELVELGREFNIPVMEDLGSGALVDLRKFGLPYEPVVKERLAAGADIVTFSGDKLLGGPQAGIIVGKRKFVDLMRKNPLSRALRLCKLTISALEATLQLYLKEENLPQNLPSLSLLTRTKEEIQEIAKEVHSQLEKIFKNKIKVTLKDGASQVGSGSLPLETLPTKCIALRSDRISAEEIAAQFRDHSVPIIGRVQDDEFIMDMRTVKENDIKEILSAAENLNLGKQR